MSAVRTRRFRPVLLPPRRRWSAADARAVLSQLEASGLAVAEFAARAGLDPQRLYRWRAQLGGAPPAFVEIARAPVGSPPIEAVLRSGHVLRVPEGVCEETLRRVVRALEDERGC